MTENPDLGTAQRTILLAEYAALRSEITTLLSVQGQFLNFGIVFFGVVVAMSNRQTGMPGEYWPLLAIPFGVLGLSYADVALRIARAARYIDHGLRPGLKRLGGDECLRWETYIREQYPARGLMNWLDRLRWSIFLGPAVVFSWLALQRGLSSQPWLSWRWFAWTVGAGLVVLNVVAMNRVTHFSKRVTQT